MEWFRETLQAYGAKSNTWLQACSKALINPKSLSGPCPELLFSIFDFLSLADTVCLSYCNRRLREVSSAHIRNLWSEKDQICRNEVKFSVLQRLERDFPRFFACEICKTLHRYDGSESFGLGGHNDDMTCTLPCVNRTNGWFAEPFKVEMSSISPSPDLSTLQLKLATRRFFYGPQSGISTTSLQYLQVRNFSLESDGSDALSLSSRQVMILPGQPVPRFIVRLQNVLLVSSWDNLTASALSHCADDPNQWISSNKSAKGYRVDDVFKDIRICGQRRLFETDWGRQNLIAYLSSTQPFTRENFYCPQCGSESQITIWPFESRTAVVLTTWFHLGDGTT